MVGKNARPLALHPNSLLIWYGVLAKRWLPVDPTEEPKWRKSLQLVWQIGWTARRGDSLKAAELWSGENGWRIL